jgi:ribose 5-phosphate isomerase B
MIYLGSDHGGFSLKQEIIKILKHRYEDLGNTVFDKDDDYPEYAFRVAEKVGKEDRQGKWDERPKGILLCRSAGGVIIAANKVRNVRAVAVFDERSAKHSREHNDANVIAISGDWTSVEEAKKIVKAWLSTEFSGDERHRRRLKQIEDYERQLEKNI